MSNHPATVFCLKRVVKSFDFFQPVMAKLKYNFRVIFGDVPQMICN